MELSSSKRREISQQAVNILQFRKTVEVDRDLLHLNADISGLSFNQKQQKLRDAGGSDWKQASHLLGLARELDPEA
jgi:hypothetical protein